MMVRLGQVFGVKQEIKAINGNTIELDISAYAGSNIQLRFNRVVGNTWQADIALDNINLLEPVAPTCNDGIQNGDETGVDCGGSSCTHLVLQVMSF